MKLLHLWLHINDILCVTIKTKMISYDFKVAELFGLAGWLSEAEFSGPHDRKNNSLKLSSTCTQAVTHECHISPK